jgi:hypothetical protein
MLQFVWRRQTWWVFKNFDFLTYCTILLRQLGDSIFISPTTGLLMEKLCVIVSFIEPLDARPLLPHNLLL